MLVCSLHSFSFSLCLVEAPSGVHSVSPLFFISLSALWMPFQESTWRRKRLCIYHRGQHHPVSIRK